MKERELEVQKSRSAQEQEWGKEKDQLRNMEVILLGDLMGIN